MGEIAPPTRQMKTLFEHIKFIHPCSTSVYPMQSPMREATGARQGTTEEGRQPIAGCNGYRLL